MLAILISEDDVIRGGFACVKKDLLIGVDLKDFICGVEQFWPLSLSIDLANLLLGLIIG